MAMLDAAVNRTSGHGTVFAAEQSVTVYEALQPITVNAAHQSFEEGLRGTLEVGKLADLVVPNRDPLSIDPLELVALQVQATIKEGRTIDEAPV